MSDSVLNDILLLYELSLSVGSSLELEKNCDGFLSVLMARRNLDYSSVWIKDSFIPGAKKQNKLNAIYSNPKVKLKYNTVSDDYFVLDLLENKEFVAIYSDDENFKDHILETSIKGGVIVYYKLDDLGYLKLYSSVQKKPLNVIVLNKLNNIIQKFTVSIKASLQHEHSLYNIAQRQKAEKNALKSSQRFNETSARLTHLIQNMQEAILVENEYRKIVVVNNQFLNYFKLDTTPESLIGADSSSICKKVKCCFDSDVLFMSEIETVLNNREMVTGYELVLGDGRIFERDYIPILIEDQYRGHLWKYRDVTQQRHMVLDLEEAKLTAESASRSKSGFLANMSHEIRTPLNGIIGMSKLLDKSALDTEQRSYSDAIIQSSENLLVIINDILDFSKIEAGKLSLEEVGMDLKGVMKSAIQSMSFKAEEKNLRLTSYYDDSIPSVLIGDSVRISQILINLLGNALKFTSEGYVHLGCRLVSVVDNKHVIRISVEDTGIGIDKDKLGLIFDNFTQEDVQVTRKYGGTGLGLSIVKQLVGLMNGSVNVKSGKGEGSTFIITLPFEVGKEKDLVTKEVQAIDPCCFGVRKVLLVDDQQINRFLIVSIFKNWNIPIVEAVDGKDAVEKLSKEDFDLVLMDIQMPVMDGFEATSVIRNKMKLDIPIIALSANAMKENVDRCLSSGMDDFLSKPFEPNDLLVKMRRLFKGDMVDVSSTPVKEKPIEKVSVDPPVSTEKLYDINALGAMVNHDPKELGMLLSMFLDSTPTNLEQMETLLLEEDFYKIGRVVHKMKPSITLMKMNGLISIMKTLENPKKTSKSDLTSMVHDFVAKMRVIVDCISKEVES